jgi:asparagine synthase (glutamine-hydrolysing)
MCGIAGLQLADHGTDRTPILSAMLACLTRRGPDSEGMFHHGGASLGHRRLSIVDLSPQGNQPMLNETGDIALVCNGELYGYHGLRAELIERGHRFVSHSDSEVILHLYEERGIEAVDALRGMFAFAILDARRNEIHLARDRFGIKPLYWTNTPEGFAFASELRALLACPYVNRDVDLSAFSRYLCFYYVPSPHSMVRGVRALEPGHVLTYREGRVTERAYWRATDHLGRAEPAAGFARERFEDELDGLLADTVRVHLNADVPVGAFLSGGVDSSGIVAYASQCLSRVQTFCLVHDDPAYDERVWAARVAEHCRTDHVEVRVNAGQKFEPALLDFLVDVYGEPFASPSAIAVQSVIQAMKNRVKCVLSGDGADEIFAGYDDYARYRRMTKLQRVLPGSVALRLAAGERFLRFPGGDKVRRALELAQWDGLDFLYGDKGFFPFAQQSALLADPILAQLDLEHESLYLLDKLGVRDDAKGFDLIYRFHLLQQLPDYMMTKTDRASMGHSVEVRVPYVDHLVFEHLCRAPAEVKFDADQPKPLLKRVLERHLPRNVLYRSKQGFAVHLEAFVGDAFWPYFSSLLHETGGAFFKVAAVERLVQRLRTGNVATVDRIKLMYQIWIIAIFLHWKRRVLDAPSQFSRVA